MTVTHALGETADGGSRVPVTDAAREALVRARDHLLSLQHELGWWQGELETNVTMDAEDLLMRQFLGAGDAAHTAAEARWIRSQQRDDGTWANFYGGPGDLSTTIEAYVALRLAGDLPTAPHMAQAAQWIRAAGRAGGEPRLHPDLAGHVRRVALGRPAGHPARADLPAGLVPAQHLRLGLLGPADDRGARHRQLPAPGPQAPVRPAGTAHRRHPAGPSQRPVGEGLRPARRGHAHL